MSTTVEPMSNQNSATVTSAPVKTEQFASTDVAPTRSEEYYLDTVTIQVDRTLFKVPQYRFVEGSSVFRDMYAMPQDGNQDVEGTSDERPIIIQGVDKVDFVNFLRELYPRSQTTPPAARSLAEWTAILKLSTMWEFTQMRDSTISRMDASIDLLPAVEKVLLGYEHGVEHWLLEGLTNLVLADRVIAEEEWTRLGWQWAFRLFTERERCVSEGHLKDRGPGELGCPLGCGNKCTIRDAGSSSRRSNVKKGRSSNSAVLECQHGYFNECCSCGQRLIGGWTAVDVVPAGVRCSESAEHRQAIKRMFQEELKTVECRGHR